MKILTVESKPFQIVGDCRCQKHLPAQTTRAWPAKHDHTRSRWETTVTKCSAWQTATTVFETAVCSLASRGLEAACTESQVYIQVKSSISSEMNITRYYPLRPLDPTCVANWDAVFGYNPYATQGGYSDDNGFRVRRRNFVAQPVLNGDTGRDSLRILRE